MSEPTEPSTFPMKRCKNCRVLNPPAAARCRSCLGLNFEEIKPGIDLSQPPEDMNPIHKIIHPDPHTNLPHDSDEMSNRATLLAELLGDTVFTPNPLTDSQITDLQKKFQIRQQRSLLGHCRYLPFRLDGLFEFSIRPTRWSSHLDDNSDKPANIGGPADIAKSNRLDTTSNSENRIVDAHAASHYRGHHVHCPAAHLQPDALNTA